LSTETQIDIEQTDYTLSQFFNSTESKVFFSLFLSPILYH